MVWNTTARQSSLSVHALIHRWRAPGSSVPEIASWEINKRTVLEKILAYRFPTPSIDDATSVYLSSGSIDCEKGEKKKQLRGVNLQNGPSLKSSHESARKNQGHSVPCRNFYDYPRYNRSQGIDCCRHMGQCNLLGHSLQC